MLDHRSGQTFQGQPAPLSRCARTGAKARTCLAMLRHRVVERSRTTLSIKILKAAPVEAANSAISWTSAKAGGAARSYVSWEGGAKRSALVPVRLYLARLSASWASAEAAAPQAAAATAEDASSRLTHTSTLMNVQQRISVHWCQQYANSHIKHSLPLCDCLTPSI